MFKLEPCPSDFAQTARFFFDNEVVVAGDPDQVFDVVASIEHERAWFPDFKEAHWLTPEPPGEGATRDYRLSYMRILEHFTIWRRGEQLSFWVSECSLPILRRFFEDYTFSAAADGRTRLKWRVAYEPNPYLRPLHPLLRPIFARDFRKATTKLVAYCESLYGGEASARQSR